MISKKFKELNYELFDENDYEIYFTDECITLVKILSEDAWKSISKYTKKQPVMAWDNSSTENNDNDIFMASTDDGQVTILNFKDKIYTQSGEIISLYQWLKIYYQLLPYLMTTGEKHNILALTIHSEYPIVEKCYEDILEENELFYESDRLMRCPIARQAVFTLDGMLVRYFLDDLTLNERALSLACEPMAIIFFSNATPEERLSVIQKIHLSYAILMTLIWKNLP
jgi:hypothetical protein